VQDAQPGCNVGGDLCTLQTAQNKGGLAQWPIPKATLNDFHVAPSCSAIMLSAMIGTHSEKETPQVVL
jgi:hypothetical protein